MKIDELKKALERAKILVKEMEVVEGSISASTEEEKIFMNEFLANANNELKKISKEIPNFLAKERERKNTGKIELYPDERKEYLHELEIEEEALKLAMKKIEKRKKQVAVKSDIYESPSFFVKKASRIFSSMSMSLVKTGLFKNLELYLRKASLPYLLSTYISIILLSTLISVGASLILLIPLMSLGILAVPVAFIIPIIVFVSVMLYPMSEASSIKGRIDDELPFAIMHMSAVAGSGVEPTRVFSILAASHEYPKIRKEMMKLVNLINFYGYDLTTALKTTAKITPSQRLADVLNGMSTTISGGGDLKAYLDKIAADSILDYKLRRKRFTTVSETYADIYTGLLIAAPLMFMLLLVLMNVIGGGIGGMSTTTIATIGIGAIALLNVGFLVFLRISQPES